MRALITGTVVIIILVIIAIIIVVVVVVVVAAAMLRNLANITSATAHSTFKLFVVTAPYKQLGHKQLCMYAMYGFWQITILYFSLSLSTAASLLVR